MLRARILTAMLLLPVVVLLILKLPSPFFELISGMFFILAAWEWSILTGVKVTGNRVALILSIIGIACCIRFVFFKWAEWLFGCALLWWMLGAAAVYFYPTAKDIWKQKWVVGVIGFLMFVPAWLALCYIHLLADGPQWVLCGCLIIWVADTGAYFVGKKYGKKKLAARVSPGKTWAGLVGSFIATSFLAAGMYAVFEPTSGIFLLLALCFVTTMFSVVGDLVESLFKRTFGFKDSGSLLPGHGGMLDRLDSMLAALPIYALGLKILENPRIM